MTVTARIALEVACHEALVRQAYLDSEENLTWSIGLTSQSGHNVERYIDNPASIERCLEVYVWALRNYATAVKAEFRGHDLTEEQFGAALCFHWNTGAIRSASWPDMWKRGNVAAARSSFLSWRKPPEIIGRREKEAALFFDGEWSNQDGMITEWTRVKPSGYIDWTEARKIDISGPMTEAFGGKAPEEEMPALGAREALSAIREIAGRALEGNG